MPSNGRSLAKRHLLTALILDSKFSPLCHSRGSKKEKSVYQCLFSHLSDQPPFLMPNPERSGVGKERDVAAHFSFLVESLFR